MTATSRDSHPPLLFHWKRPKTLLSIRLLAAGVAAVVIHGLCFYVFQIEAPAARRALPKTHEIVLLAAGDAQAAGLLKQVEDYYAGFEGTLNPRSQLQIAVDSLPKKPPAAPADPEIRPLHAAFPAMDTTAAETTPPVAVLPETPTYVTPPVRELDGLRLVLCPALEARGWLDEEPVIAFDDPAAVAPESGQISWRVAVTASGQVEFVFPLRVRESPELDQVTTRLRQSRFHPEDGTALQWGTITLQW